MSDENQILLEEIDVIDEPTEVEVEEASDVVQVSEVETFVVESDHAFAPIGETNEYLKHSLLTGRDLPGEHPITAITGLRQELNDIEELQPHYSDMAGVADYYEWYEGASEEVGYFVSLVQHTSKIQICDGKDIFGVTVDKSGFIGNEGYIEEENEDGTPMKVKLTRGASYALVATTGFVDVRCETDVEEGDYVVSNLYGIARKTTSGYGYKVIGRETRGGINYAEIALGVQADVTDRIGVHLQVLDDRMDNAEANISSLAHALNSTKDRVDNLEGDVSELQGLGTQATNAMLLASQAKAIAESAVVSAESLRKEAVDAANKALVDATETRKEFEELSREMDENLNNAALELQETQEELYSTRDSLKSSIDDAKEDIESMRFDLIPLESWVSKDGQRSSIVGFVAQANEDSAKIGTLAEYIDGTNRSLAGFKTEVAKNYATLTQLASLETKTSEADVAIKAIADANKAQLDAVSDFEYKDANGNVVSTGLAGLTEQVSKDSASITTLASYTASETIAVVETWNSESEDANDKTKIYYAKVNGKDAYYYYDGTAWKAVVGWNAIPAANKNIEYVYYVKGTKQYWYYDGSQWKSTSKSYEAGLDGALAGVQQTADENSAKVAAIASLEGEFGESLAGFVAEATEENAQISALASYNGGAAGLIAQVEDNKASIEAIAGIDGDIAGLRAQVNENTSQVALVANRVKGEYTVIPLTTESADKDISKIYYDDTTQLYWYYSGGKWNTTSTWGALASVLSTNQVYYVSGSQLYWHYKDGVWASTEDAYEAGLPAVIGGIQVETDDNSAQINQLTSWRGETNTAMALIKQKADENGASISLLATNIDKYTVGDYSQAYNFTYEQACDVLESGMIYIPTSTHDEQYEYTEVGSNGDKVTLAYNYSFTSGNMYVWTGDGSTIWTEYANTVWFGSSAPAGNAYELWYDGEVLYKQTATDDGNVIWTPVATVYGNSSNRAVSQIRMDANSIALEVTNVKGDAAISKNWIDENSANIQDVVSWHGDNGDSLVTFMQTADDNYASAAQVAQIVDKDGNVQAASIVTAVNESGSGVMIDADHIRFDGFVSFANKSDVEEVQSNAVYDTKVEYALSSSSTEFIAIEGTDGQWSTIAPNWQEDAYMWQRTTVTKGDESVASTETCIQGAKGEDGEPGQDGEPGSPGAQVKSARQQFCVSTSDTSYDEDAWGDAPTGFTKGSYLWVRTVYTLDNGDEIVGEASLDRTYTTISSWCMENDETLINGANIATGTVTADKITVEDDNGILFEADVNNNYVQAGGFYVDHNSLYSGATFKNSGIILSSSGTESTLSVNGTSQSGWKILAGPEGSTTKNFGVDDGGYLYASGADIQGTIKADGGYLDNLVIEGNLFFGGNEEYYISANYDNSDWYVNLPGLKIDEDGVTSEWSDQDGTFGWSLTANGFSLYTGGQDVLSVNSGGMNVRFETPEPEDKSGTRFGWWLLSDNFSIFTSSWDPNEGEDGAWVDTTLIECNTSGAWLNNCVIGSSCTVKGTLEAASGKIGNWTIINGGIYGVPKGGVYTYGDGGVNTVSCYCVAALQDDGFWYYLIDSADIATATVIASTRNILDFNGNVM